MAFFFTTFFVVKKNAVWSLFGPELKSADVSTFMWIKYKYNEEEDGRERWWIFLFEDFTIN